MAIERPVIYPLDCLVIGVCASALPKDAHRSVLHFWGYRREELLDKSLDNTELSFVDHYEPTSSSSHGATDNPIYHTKKLRYLGLRTVNVDVIMQYFRLHFDLKPMASANMAFSIENGEGRKPVLARWPDSQWYFLFPIGREGVASRVMRDNIWNAWQPSA